MPDLRIPDLNGSRSAPPGGPAASALAPTADESEQIVVEVQEFDDGSVNIVLGDPLKEQEAEDQASATFDENLADELDGAALVDVLMRGIDADIASRTEWTGMYTEGLELLGLKNEKRETGPRKYTSTVRHPLLLASIIEGQARARGELLPADGPIKVRNDGEVSEERKQRSDDLQSDMNHYLTVTAVEYYPDTDRGLFLLYYGGAIFKKVYRCPTRKRPVSECVYAPDLILSNDATDLINCRRITHLIEMSQDEVQQLIDDGFYADVPLGQPTPTPTPVKAAESRISGIQAIAQLPEDMEHTLYECYPIIDLADFGFTSDDGTRPYVITIDKDTRQLYSARRFWTEGDDQFKRRRRFVKFGLIPGMGFLDYGYVHILGGYTRALTAILRIMIDAGMFSNFPGGVRAKGARITDNEIIAGPGQFPEVDTSASGDIRSTIMALPFKGPSAELLQLYTMMEESGAKLAGSVSVETGDGRTNVPVGTIMAQIEQQTQVMAAVHKRQHTSQQEEFTILKELIAEDPEVLTRNELDPIRRWTREELLDADLVPASDPNVPAHIHRIMQAIALEQLATAHPEIYDPIEVQKELLSVARLGNPERLFRKTPPQAPAEADPTAGMTEAAKIQAQGRLAEAQLKDKTEQIKAQLKDKTDQLKTMLDARDKQEQGQLQAADIRLRQAEQDNKADEAEKERQSREAIAAMNAQTQLILKGLEALNAPTEDEPARDKKAGPG